MSTDEITPEGQRLGQQAVRGASATIVGQVVRLVVMLASTVVLARILSPEDFGLVAIVMSIVALGELVRDFGLSLASARALKLTQGQMSNLFWINTLFGLLLAGGGLLIAAPVAIIFSQPKLSEIVVALSLTFVLSGISTQFRARINQQLMFKRLALVDTAPVIAGLLGALAYAVLVEANYWVLVAQQISTSFTAVVMAIALSRWWPGWPSRRASVREVFGFGLGVFGSQGVAYITKNIDNLSLGYVWGPGVLGIYGRAYQLLMLPLSQLAAPLTRVAVPILTKVADDRERFHRFLLKGQLIGSVGLGSIYAVACGLAHPLVSVVFGGSWIAMVPVFQALAIGGIFRGLNQITFWIFLAKNRTGAQFRFYLVSQPLIVAAILAGLPWGAVGVAIGHSIGYLVNWILSMWWCGRTTSTDMMPITLNGLKAVALLVIPMIGIGLLASTYVESDWVSIATGLVGIAVYTLLIYFVSPFFRDVVQTVAAVARKIR